MKIASVSDISALQAARTKQQIGTAVLKKTLNVAKAQGQAAVALIDSATQLTGQPQGRGGLGLDVVA